jgi:hypothetical protein
VSRFEPETEAMAILARGNPMQIRDYAGLNEERRSFFYTRWFCCVNKACKTTLVMPARYKVVTNKTSPPDEAA